MKYFNQVKAVFTGLLLSSSVVPVVSADDIEIYTTLPPGSGTSNPNIMFVVDTSVSMGTELRIKPFYDPEITYPPAGGALRAGATACESSGIYRFTTDEIDAGLLDFPDCAGDNYFNRSALVCDHAVVGYNIDGTKITSHQDGSLLMVGTYSDQMAYYDTTSERWLELDDITDSDERDYKVECLSDSGIHGDNGGGNSDYIIDGGTGFTNSEAPHTVWANGAGNKQLFSGNYINYNLWQPADDQLVSKSYIEQVKGAVNIMVRGNTQVDIGLMRFDRMSTDGTEGNSEGGPVLYPIRDVGADRTDFFNRLESLESNGFSPLSETYYEALLYYGGKAMDYSMTSQPRNQITSLTEKPGNVEFRSPVSSSCDKNYIVVLTAGSPTLDYVDAGRQAVLPGFSGTCGTTTTTTPLQDLEGNIRNEHNAVDNCLDELSAWAATQDAATEAGNAAHVGEQNIYTHTIGLGINTEYVAPELTVLDISESDYSNDDTAYKLALAAAEAVDATAIATEEARVASANEAVSLLKSTAENGEGGYYHATDQGSLVTIFNEIVNAILDVNSTFSSPAVSVNAYNRSTHLNDLYFTLFKPATGNHWDGNLKKYKLKFAVDTTERLPFIAGQSDVPAIDPDTGFFVDAVKSYWTPNGDGADGQEVSEGGAVSVLPETRNVYTFTGGYSGADTGVNVPDTQALTDTSNKVVVSNNDLTAELLGIPAEPAIVEGTENRTTLINWAKGLDALSQYGELDTYSDIRPQMGDPLHSEPALVQYGLTDAGLPDLVAYVATNDGYLHAINVNTGVELFSFIPQELLSKLPRVMLDKGGNKTYGLDGNVVAWINDVNGDGDVNDDGDHVYLYVSMRRGGNNIYALDVSTRTAPELMWVIKGGTGNYSELGQTWSTINVEKIKDGTDGSEEKTVLIFGGGYDPDQDTATVTSVDDVGGTVYIADATSGARLWTADAHDEGTPLVEMNYSVPARVKPLDISGDGYIDRLYVADMGGQIFRFDINNTNTSPLASSITGGLMADLGDASTAADAKTEANARRFYYPPDVALIDAPDGKYHALVISSGFRAHPLNTAIHDRIYMIKDRNTGLITSNSDYKYDPNSDTAGSLTETDLHNATANLAGGNGSTDTVRSDELTGITGAQGWFINLDDEDADSETWIGEKGLAEALIIEGVAIVTTYTPDLAYSADSCGPNIGLGKVFFLDMLDATPAFPGSLDERGNRHIELVRGGIPPTPNVIITEDGVPTLCIGTECQKAEFGLGVRKTYWYEVN